MDTKKSIRSIIQLASPSWKLVVLLSALVFLLWTLGFVPRTLGFVPRTLPPLYLTVHNEYGFYCFHTSLPNITIYATGGTMAGSGSSLSKTTDYKSGVLFVDTLIDGVPHLCEEANLRLVQFANVDSINIDEGFLTSLSQQIAEELKRDDVQGVDVLGGTDLMEKTAYFLDQTIMNNKPVVITGAIRPSTAYSADGPMNLLESVALAASEDARGRGVMVSLNSNIWSARNVEKINPNHPGAFGTGDLGIMHNNQPRFYNPASRSLDYHFFDISKLPREGKYPQVVRISDPEIGLFEDSVNRGAKGIVLEGFGAGYWPQEAADKIKESMRENGIVVAMSRGSSEGFVGSPPIGFGIGAGFLNPLKTQVKLWLCLAKGYKMDNITRIFQGPHVT